MLRARHSFWESGGPREHSGSFNQQIRVPMIRHLREISFSSETLHRGSLKFLGG